MTSIKTQPIATTPHHVLVTGGAGFIGSHTVDSLLAHECRVSVVDDLSTGYVSNLTQCQGHPNFLFLEADLTKDVAKTLERATKRFGAIEKIVHFAAQTAVPASVADPLTDIQVNVAGTVALLEYARHHRVQKVVFASSSAVYDDDAPVPVTELSRARPASPYGVDKLAAELFLDYYARYHGVPFTALRFMNVYGPRQDPSSHYSGVISIFMDHAAAGLPITIFDDGEQTRDFVYVTDVARAVVTAALSEAANNAIINIGTGVEVSINSLVRAILDLTRSSSSVRYEPPRPGDIRRSTTTMDRAHGLLAFVPQVGLREGLTRTYRWVQDQASLRARTGSAA